MVNSSNLTHLLRLSLYRDSSNIDAGVNIGTIFGIYKVAPGSTGQLSDVLRPGSEMVVAGYAMYGSSANLVLSFGEGVNGYTLDNVSVDLRVMAWAGVEERS